MALKCLFIFISKTQQKVRLLLRKRHVHIVAYFYRHYTSNWVNIDEESHSYLCYTHCNHDCNHDYNIIVIDYIQNQCNIVIVILSSNCNRLPWSCNRHNPAVVSKCSMYRFILDQRTLLVNVNCGVRVVILCM